MALPSLLSLFFLIIFNYLLEEGTHKEVGGQGSVFSVHLDAFTC